MIYKYYGSLSQSKVNKALSVVNFAYNNILLKPNIIEGDNTHNANATVDDNSYPHQHPCRT